MTTAVAQYETPTDLPQKSALVSAAESMIVVDQDTFEYALECAKDWKATWNRVEEERVKRRAPIDALYEQLASDFKPILDTLNACINIAKGKATKWQAEQKALALKRQQELDAAAAAAAKDAEAKAKALEKKGNIEAAEAVRQVAAVTTAPVVAPTVTRVAGTSNRANWQGRIENDIEFVAWLATSHPEFIASCIDFKLAGLNALAKLYRGKPIPGLKQSNEEKIAL
jgi:hypothetical protein